MLYKMKKTIIIFIIVRIIAYVVITSSYLKHGISLGLLFTLFFIIELQVWITYFSKRKDIKKLLDDTSEHLKKEK